MLSCDVHYVIHLIKYKQNKETIYCTHTFVVQVTNIIWPLSLPHFAISSCPDLAVLDLTAGA